MLYWSVMFFIVALIAGIFGFGGLASVSVGIAQAVFALFAFLFFATLLIKVLRD